MFNLLGYTAATLAWSSYRGPNLPAQPADLATAAANQVFSDQGAVVTAYIIAGYVSIVVLVNVQYNIGRALKTHPFHNLIIK